MPAANAATRIWAEWYLSRGLSVIPIKPTNKTPSIPGWRAYSTEAATAFEVNEWYTATPFAGPGAGVGVVPGPASGNLVVLDFDRTGDPVVGDPFEEWKAGLSVGLAAVLRTCPIVRTPSGGRHVWCRLVQPVRGEHFAWYANRDVKIETRGEGQYALAPGCPPTCHETGRVYEFEQLGWLATPADGQGVPMPADVWAELLKRAEACNEFVHPEPSPDRGENGAPAGDGDPGIDFNFNGTWAETGLFDHDWTWCRGIDSERGYLTRPGKESGVSASIGMVSSKANGWPLFYCFSSSAAPFEAGRAYCRWRVYAMLNHPGDFKAAARTLKYDLGYGNAEPGVTLGDELDVDLSEFRFGSTADGKPFYPFAKPQLPALPAVTPPDPAPLANVNEYQPFPVEMLPEAIRGFVVDGANAMYCDPALIAMPLLTVLASAIGNTRRLKLKETWRVPPILWTAVVSESGSTKTPAFNLALGPVHKLQNEAFASHKQQADQYRVDALCWDKEMAAWKRSKIGGDPPEPPPEPTCVRYYVSDTTVEALAPILAANPRGLLLARDELSGWFGSFDRYAGKGKVGADSSNWLSMYNALTISVDRKTGVPKTLHVPRTAVSVCGGIPPDILRRSLSAEHRESGLAARFLLAYPPKRTKQWSDADIDPTAIAAVERLIKDLYNLESSTNGDAESWPVTVRMDADAMGLWITHYGVHAGEQKDLSGDLSAAWSKLEEHPARLALVFHFVRWAAGQVKNETILDADSMAAGIALTDWFKNETRRIYAMRDESEADQSQKKLIEWITKKGGTVSPREVHRGCRRWIGDSAKARAALKQLAEDGLGRWKDQTTFVLAVTSA